MSAYYFYKAILFCDHYRCMESLVFERSHLQYKSMEDCMKESEKEFERRGWVFVGGVRCPVHAKQVQSDQSNQPSNKGNQDERNDSEGPSEPDSESSRDSEESSEPSSQ
jgi:hypothetical protein